MEICSNMSVDKHISWGLTKTSQGLTKYIPLVFCFDVCLYEGNALVSFFMADQYGEYRSENFSLSRETPSFKILA